MLAKESRILDLWVMLALRKARVVFIWLLAFWLLLTTSAVTVVTWPRPRLRAVLCMGWGLIIFWIILGGSVMYRFREPIRQFVERIRLDWRVKFVLFATLLAMLEEAVTTSMTNLAPLFGVKIGEAYITASANYLDVIALHSVVVFVPMFVGWAVILWRYSFSPFAVFMIFGITGTLAEMGFGGAQQAGQFAFWIFVYGLMVFLPAYCVPTDRAARQPRWWLYPLAVFVPFIFIPIVPLPLIAGLLSPHHPKIHFPPITG